MLLSARFSVTLGALFHCIDSATTYALNHVECFILDSYTYEGIFFECRIRPLSLLLSNLNENEWKTCNGTIIAQRLHSKCGEGYRIRLEYIFN